MSSKEKHISLARVLVALAWADGTISPEEMNYLKDIIFKLDLTGEEWAQIEMYMEDPVSPEERMALVEDFIKKMGLGENRKELFEILEGLIQADGVTTPEESDFLKQFQKAIQGTGSSSALLDRIRGLFQKTVFQPVRGSRRSEELHDFINNRILFKVRRKLERDKLTLEADSEKLRYATLFAGLLAHVASAHEALNEQEEALLRDHLKNIADFDEEAVELIFSVIREASSAGRLDRFRLTREFYERSTPEQRLHLVGCLFDIAGSDTDLEHAEVEEVRRIAYGLKLTHRDFIRAKVQHIEREKGQQ